MSNVVPIGSEHICHRCDKYLPAELDGCMVMHLDGGYAMFHDNIETQCRITHYLCHDCSAELFRWMMIDPKIEGQGLHPYMDSQGKGQDNPCCEFGWNSVRDTDGEWRGKVTYGWETM